MRKSENNPGETLFGAKEAASTPLMKQYFELKSKHPDAILLYRVGDFYETFGEDAVKTSAALGIILSNRNNGGSNIELAGFPYHSLDLYLPKLVRAGYRVAICEQLEKPSPLKKVVKRGITEVVTPGVTIDETLLDHKRNNYLASILPTHKEATGIAFLDISTGELMVSEGDRAYIDKLLQGFQPAEIILPKSSRGEWEKHYADRFYTYYLDDWVFSADYGRQQLLDHFGVASLKGFGIEDMHLAPVAAGVALHYLATTENRNLKHIVSIRRLHQDKYVWLDRFTIRNLELLQSNHESGKSLLDILDQTSSPMGGRLLKKWMVLPLRTPRAINERLDVVTWMLENSQEQDELESHIRLIGDLERLISKVPLGKITPRETVQLKKALAAIEPIKSLLSASGFAHLVKIAESLNPCNTLRDKIRHMLIEDPPAQVNKGGYIADGCHPDLDDLRHVIRNSKQLLIDIQQREAQRTGIDNLKVGFNNVFGYYLEVTNKHKYKDTIPADWIRKQTTSLGERYITEELKQLETKIMTAEERILDLEEKLFRELVESMTDYIEPVQLNAGLIARLDCLMTFARVARRNNYVRPEITEDLGIDIREGRHPVIEQQLPPGENYVPNDVFLDTETQQIIIITGPNMAGKSALLRQTALICLMGQMGSYVPASHASIGVVDKVFTRVGASDNISSGESTFMVEMNETASIMNNISERSLILLDEIGRGTSTYDGISIAWSIAEFLHDNGIVRPKTLFATHYHELNELAEQFPRIKNFHVATREADQKVIFLRKLTPGGSEHSFGIHVAKMAGMPKTIVDRANQILEQLEEKHLGEDEATIRHKASPDMKSAASNRPLQLSIFETTDPQLMKVRDLLLQTDLNGMTPIDCMMKLNELKKLLEK